jgi:GNAT superfamily N-acetyltransferase
MTDPMADLGEVTIRVLTADDWREWRTLRRAALGDSPAAFSSKLADWSGSGDFEHRWRERLAGPSYDLVATLADRPAGMASGILAGPREAELISMWVAPFARGHGVGAALIDAIADWARATGRKSLQLRVVEGNHPATRLYERRGFVDVGRAPAEPGEDQIERLMILELHRPRRKRTGQTRPAPTPGTSAGH